MRKLQRLMMLLLACLLTVGTAYADDLLAFPGAQGWGRFAKGARASSSPTIYHVTNLNDSGTGSFRDAVSQPNRIIVFDVAGTIKIKSGIVFSKNLTVLGQTAPGDGVQIYGDRVSFSGADNLIVRFMRFRMGKSAASGQKDACGVANGGNMIFDHLSVLWGRDENFSISWDNKGTSPHDITIQNSIIGQGLQSHSCGGLIQTEGGVTLFRNLYIENKTRNPKVKHLNQFINNVVYNWGNGGCYLMGRESSGNSWAEIVNNYFVKGPWDTGYKPLQEGNDNFQFYGDGNYYDDDRDGQLNGHLYTDAEYDASGALRRASVAEITNSPKEFPVITELMTAEEAIKWIIDSVGASLPARDDVDQYLIDELASFGTGGSNGGISDETSLPHKGTGMVSPGNKPQDSDNDGIPDEWETANGLNPNDASDAVKVAANGYLNIENYSFTITEAYPYIKVPTALKVTEQQTQSISISWTDNAKNEEGYIIEYSTDNKKFSEAGRVAANTTAYTATGLTKEQTYYFRVKAYGAGGLESLYTSVLTTETIGDPAAPKQCSKPSPAVGEEVGTATGEVTLSWENSTKDYYGKITYLIYFGTDKDNLSRIGTTQLKTYTHSVQLEAGKTYYWRVNARNNIGSTEGTLWSFNTVKGGVLFETDFNTKPEAFANKYPGTSNTNIINGNTSTTVGGMTFGATGSSSARIVSFSDSGLTGDYSASDAGATPRCVEFTSGSGYIQFPEVEGPCTVTIWTGNSDTSSKTFKLNTIVNGSESTATTFDLKAAKKNFKHTYTYMGTGKVVFKIDNNGKKFRVHDVLIEKYVSDDPTPSDPVSAGLSYGSSEADNAKIGEAYTARTLTNPHNVSVTYSSSNTAVATVNAQGAVTLVGAGETTITATFAGSSDYLAGNASYKLIVSSAGSDPDPDKKYKQQVMYSWESPEGTVSQKGGTATMMNAPDGAADRVNYANANYHTICLNGKYGNMGEAASNNATYIQLDLDEALAEGDSVWVTAYINKGTGAEGSAYIAAGSCTFNDGVSYNDIADGTSQPNTLSYALTSGAAGQKVVKMSRGSKSGTNVFITKLVITRWVEDDGSDPDPTPEPVSAELSYGDSQADNVVVGEAYTARTLTNPHNVSVTYSSSNTAVATVNGQGAVTIAGPGETTITATFAGNDDYLAGSASYKLVVAEPVGITNHAADADSDAPIYNTQGVRLNEAPRKGIYFRGNKKYVAR